MLRSQHFSCLAAETVCTEILAHNCPLLCSFLFHTLMCFFCPAVKRLGCPVRNVPQFPLLFCPGDLTVAAQHRDPALRHVPLDRCFMNINKILHSPPPSLVPKACKTCFTVPYMVYIFASYTNIIIPWMRHMSSYISAVCQDTKFIS